jgi:uncharacterized protein involved in outer membrane biogenesis
MPGTRVAASPGMPKKKTLAGVAVGVLIALLAAPFVVLALMDWNQMRGWIGQQALERTGRELVIEGDLKVQAFSFNPRVTADRITFANADWADRAPMLQAEHVDFRISLYHLLRGRIVIPEATLDRASVRLQRSADGRANWILDKEQRDDGEPPRVLRLALNQGQLWIKDAKTATDVQAKLQTVQGKDYGLDFAALGRAKGVPFNVKGSGGGLLQLADTDEPYALRLQGTLGDAQVGFEGSITGLATLTALNANVLIAGKNLETLGDALRISLPQTKPYRLNGRLEHAGSVWKLSGFRGTVGKSDLNGDLSVDTADKLPRPLLQANLNSKNLDLADLGGFVGTEEPNPPGKVLPHSPFRLEKLRRMDARVKLVATRFQNERLPLDNLDANLRLQDGVFRLEPIVFGVAGGRMRSVVALNAQKPAIVADIDTAFQRLNLSRLIPGTEKLGQALGAVDGKVKLVGRGNSSAAILGSSNGSLDVYSHGGEVSNLLMEFAGADLQEIVAFWVGGDKKIQLRCAVVSFAARNGVLESKAIVVDTDDTVIGGQGKVSLKDETLDLTLTPLPKDMSLVSLRGPLRVTGTFADPAYGLEKKSLARKAASMVLLGLINPLAAIVPLIETGPGKDAPCADLVGTAQASAKAKGNPERSTGK